MLLIVNELLLDSRFTLIGSRRFSCEVDGSDWDFSAQHSESMHIWLTRTGFLPVDSYLPDDQCAAIYTMMDNDQRVHVITHIDEPLVESIWTNMTKKFYIENISKRTPENTKTTIRDRFNRLYSMGPIQAIREVSK